MAEASREMSVATTAGAGPADVTATAGFHAASAFLRLVYDGQERGVLVIFRKPNNASDFFHLDRTAWLSDAVANAMRFRHHSNVYFAVGLQGARPDKGRGKEVGVISVPAFWADIDVRGPNHVATALPPTIEDAMRILDAVPFKPTLIVYTGGGIQPYWLFKEHWEFASDEERNKAKAVSKAFQRHLQNAAIKCGWTMDGVADLCRALRLPGTYNRKQAEPVLVRYEVVEDGRRYNPSDFEDFLDVEADPVLKARVKGPAPEQATAEFLRVLAGCPWIRHCKDDAASLPEPEWYRMLSIVGRCNDGAHLAHELSRPYPKYSDIETTEKLEQAMGAAGPATCAFIGSDLGCGQYCADCKHRGKITSPVVLGIPKRANPGKEQCTDGGQPRHSSLPNIQGNDRQLRDVTHEGLAALRAFNDPPTIFVRGGKLVCLHKEEYGRHIITPATDRIIRNRLTRASDFHEASKQGSTNCAPPMDMVKDILATPPTEWPFPALQGIIEAPAFREDGTIITVPGYDVQSGLYYAQQDGLSVPEIPEHPTAEQINAAVSMVHDIICDFPFVDGASRTNAIAAMLTPVVRPAIKGATPLALVDATNPGTGKSLYTEVSSLITCGREAAMYSAPRDAEEWRKALTSILWDRPAVVVFDNVRYRLDNADFCRVLTETTHGDRILGKMQTINLQVRCTWIATGNNIKLGGDLPRRCYWIRMDAKCSKPFQRSGFKHKRLKEYVLKQRGELLAALLTLARAWIVSGRPAPSITPVGSYEDWSEIIGGILQHVGVQGFLGNSNELYEQGDTESVQWEAFLKILEAAFYGEPFTVAQVWERMNDKTWNDSKRQSALTDHAETLRTALPDFITQVMDREGFFKQRLGIALGERVGRRYGDSQLRVERDAQDLHAKVARWKVGRDV